jgi:hypothetical protein
MITKNRILNQIDKSLGTPINSRIHRSTNKIENPVQLNTINMIITCQRFFRPHLSFRRIKKLLFNFSLILQK